MQLFAVEGIGEVEPGTDLAATLLEEVDLYDGDVLVVTSKIVAKAAGLVVTADHAALLAEQTQRVVARRGPLSIVRTHHGLTMANAGIDASNVPAGQLVPLPADPDADAATLRADIERLAGVRVAVLIADTAGRAWRHGQTDMAIGCAGMVPILSLAGTVDRYGNELAVTAPAIADELAGAAELVSGKIGGRPVVVIRGIDPEWLTEDDGPGARALARAEGEDLFGLGARDAVIAAAERIDPIGFTVGAEQDGWDVIERLLQAAPVTATRTGDQVAIDTADPVEAGALRERIAAVAFSHQLPVRVELVSAR